VEPNKQASKGYTFVNLIMAEVVYQLRGALPHAWRHYKSEAKTCIDPQRPPPSTNLYPWSRQWQTSIVMVSPLAHHSNHWPAARSALPTLNLSATTQAHAFGVGCVGQQPRTHGVWGSHRRLPTCSASGYHQNGICCCLPFELDAQQSSNGLGLPCTFYLQGSMKINSSVVIG
jgi:hypothetical protein